ncbi:MAG: hypothetical protein JNL98_23470 [Bryobacterales bacterium]|nr:hypothetical protein [Bryobacterales bacterium]
MPEQKTSARRKNERDLTVEYFAQVYAEYRALTASERKQVFDELPESVKILVSEMEGASGCLSADSEARLDWIDISVIESRILAVLSDGALRRLAWSLRSRFRLLAGADHYQEYLASNPPNANDPATGTETLRTDLSHLLGLFQWIFGMTLVRENIRRRILKRIHVIGGVLLAVGVAAAMITLPWEGKLLGTLALIAAFGVLGATVSAQRRLQTTTGRSDPAISALGLTEFFNTGWVSLVAGGVFAVILWLILRAGFVEGALVPKWTGYLPDGPESWAKLWIWSFLAGFAERLVPDTLDRLVNRFSAPQNAVPAPLPSVPSASPSAPPAIPADVQAKLDEFGAPSKSSGAPDANAGQFGGTAENQGWKVAATVTPVPNVAGLCRVALVVARSGPSTSGPFRKAKFTLSNQFTKKPTVEVDEEDQAFSLTFFSHFPFVVGVNLLPNGPALELDLKPHWPS